MLRMIFLMLVVAASFITGGEGMTIFSVLNPRRFWVKVKGFASVWTPKKNETTKATRKHLIEIIFDKRYREDDVVVDLNQHN